MCIYTFICVCICVHIYVHLCTYTWRHISRFTEKYIPSARRLLSTALLERWLQVCHVQITFTKLPTNCFVSTTKFSMKCVVNWIPLRIRVRSRNTQPYLKGFLNPEYDASNDSATHCNTMKHTATHCNTLQHTATHSNTLRHTATYCNTLQHTATHWNTLLVLYGNCDLLH